MVLLKVRKDVKLATLGGRLFQATATRSLKSFYARWAGTDLRQFYTDYHVYTGTQKPSDACDLSRRTCVYCMLWVCDDDRLLWRRRVL